MRRWLIATGVAVVVLGSALAVAVANLGRFLDTHRAWLVSRVEREIGRQIEFGRVAVSLWGGPSVSVSGVRVPDDPSYGGGDVLRASDIRISVRLLPALVGRFEVRHVDVTAPELVVIRDQRGLNLATLGRRPRPHRRRPPSEKASPAPRSLTVLAVLRVRDGRVRFVDRRTEPPLELSLERLDLSTGHARAGHPLPVEGRAAVLGSEERNLEVTGSVGPLEDPPVMERLPLDLRVRMSDVDVGALMRACAAIDVGVPRELQASGTVALHGRAQGTIAQLSAYAKIDASAAEVRLGSAVTKPADVPFTVETAGVRENGGLVLNRAAFRLLGATVDVTGTIRPGTPPIADVQLASNRAALADLAAVLPGAAAMDVGGTAEAHLTVQGALQTEPPPAVTGTVQLTGVEARRRTDGLAIADLSTTIAVADGVARMPPTRFRAGDAALEATGSFALADRVLAVDRVAGEVFGGTIDGHGRAEFPASGPPRFSVEGAARNVGLQPLLAARRSHLAQHMAGRLDADVSLTAAGRRRRAIRRSLAGTVRIDVRDGVLHGVNVVDDVLGQVVGIRGLGTLTPGRLRKKRPELFGGADTRFEELRASARIAGGRATSDDIVMRTDAYTVTGKGSVDADGKVDLTANFVADPALTADVLGSVKDARWVTNDAHLVAVPFRVSGRLPELRVKPDPEFVARAVGRAVEERAREALGRGQKEGTRGLVDDAVRQLQRLLKR